LQKPWLRPHVGRGAENDISITSIDEMVTTWRKSRKAIDYFYNTYIEHDRMDMGYAFVFGLWDLGENVCFF
jgi:hypothetical protein